MPNAGGSMLPPTGCQTSPNPLWCQGAYIAADGGTVYWAGGPDQSPYNDLKK